MKLNCKQSKNMKIVFLSIYYLLGKELKLKINGKNAAAFLLGAEEVKQALVRLENQVIASVLTGRRCCWTRSPVGWKQSEWSQTHVAVEICRRQHVQQQGWRLNSYQRQPQRDAYQSTSASLFADRWNQTQPAPLLFTCKLHDLLPDVVHPVYSRLLMTLHSKTTSCVNKSQSYISVNAQELLWGVCILPAHKRIHLQIDAFIRDNTGGQSSRVNRNMQQSILWCC